MGPPIPHDRSRPPERDKATLSAIEKRWGRTAVDELYALFVNGTRWTRFIAHGRLAWVHADTPNLGSALFARTGATFEPFRIGWFSGAGPEAFAAVLADAQIDVVTEERAVIAAFAAVTSAQPLFTQAEANALLEDTHGPGSGADPNAVAQFEPPHFRERTLSFVVTFPYEAKLDLVLIDADTLAVRVQPLGRSQRQMMPVG